MTDGNPEVWPGWETVRVIGHGSFGAVYEVRRDVFGTSESAAVKRISIPQSESEIEDMRADGYDDNSIIEVYRGRLERITEEYSLMRKLNGTANVVSCDDFRCVSHPDGIGWDIYIKMELLQPLTGLPAERLTEREVLKIARDLCSALVLCEKNNIVHRDIKPQNIFVSPNGDYKLGDFGIAKTMKQVAGGTRVGTVKYISPEVYNNLPYGAQSDIYSLGLVLYWLLNERRLPFLPLPPQQPTAAETEGAALRRLDGEPLPPPAYGSLRLQNIVLRACAYDTDWRYRTAGEMLEDLQSLSAGQPARSVSAAVPSAPAVRTKKLPRRGDRESRKGLMTAFVILVAAALVICSACAAVLIRRHAGAETAEDVISASAEPEETASSALEDLSAQDTEAASGSDGDTGGSAASALHSADGQQAVGDTITFGSYNGEDITWRVLEVQDDKYLLISEYCLDLQPYNTADESGTWETCTLRSWLNNDFFYAAFTEQEQMKIRWANVSTDANAEYGTDSGNDTMDRVFLLGIGEAEEYFSDDEDRVCYLQDRADGQEAAACWWWTRSAGDTADHESVVCTDGALNSHGYGSSESGGVRPMIWIECIS